MGDNMTNIMGSNFNDYVELRCTDCGRPIGYIYKNSLTVPRNTCATVCLNCAAK